MGDDLAVAWMLLHREIEAFLHREADLLDERQFEEWLDLFADDLVYRIPMTRNVHFREIDREYLDADLDTHWIDEGKPTLVQRVEQIRTGVHWAEEPLSRTSHLVTNVRVTEAAEPTAHSVVAKSRLLLYRHRLHDEEDFLVAKRVDRLQRGDSGWKITERTLHLDQTVLLAKNLSMLV